MGFVILPLGLPPIHRMSGQRFYGQVVFLFSLEPRASQSRFGLEGLGTHSSEADCGMPVMPTGMGLTTC